MPSSSPHWKYATLLATVLALMSTLEHMAAAQRRPEKLVYDNIVGDPLPASTLSPACEPCPTGYFANTSIGNNCSVFDKAGQCEKIKGTCPFPEPTRGSRSTYCQPCPAGTFANKTRSVACLPCEAGKTSAQNASNCSLCPAGQIRHASWPACVHCPPGYEPLKDHTDCVGCEPRQYSNNATGFVCMACNPPRITAPNRSACFSCPPGHQSLDGDSCTPCPPGHRWNEDTGGCDPCAGGTECVYLSDPPYCARCRLCQPGSYSFEASNCTVCPPGRYEDQAGSSEPCKGCAHGDYQPSYNATACAPCQEGFYCPNASTSVPCPSGRFCPAGSESPLVCATLYDPDDTGCRPSTELIVIVAVSCTVGFAAIVLAGYLVYMKTERASKQSQETMPLRPPRDPVYGGL